MLKMPPKVEEPSLVKFIIWILKIFLFLILQSPKLDTLLLKVETRPFHIQIVPSVSLGIHVEEERS